MADRPFCEAVMDAPLCDGFIISRDTKACRRCGCRAERVEQLRPGRKPFHPLEHGKRNNDTHVCYWCQREWEIFWRTFRPDMDLFFRAKPFRPITIDLMHGMAIKRGGLWQSIGSTRTSLSRARAPRP